MCQSWNARGAHAGDPGRGRHTWGWGDTGGADAGGEARGEAEAVGDHAGGHWWAEGLWGEALSVLKLVRGQVDGDDGEEKGGGGVLTTVGIHGEVSELCDAVGRWWW